MSVNEIDVNAVNKRAKLIDPDEIGTNEDNSNLYLGIAVGVMITICAGIFLVTSWMDALIW